MNNDSDSSCETCGAKIINWGEKYLLQKCDNCWERSGDGNWALNNDIVILKRIRQILGEKKNWIQGRYASDELGNVVSSKSNEAYKFCLLGAIKKSVKEIYLPDVEFAYGRTRLEVLVGNEILKEIPEWIGGVFVKKSLIRFNDSPLTKHEDILRVLDNTIERLSAGAI